MQVAPMNIYNMLIFMADQLRKADYSFLPYIAQEVWQLVQSGFTKYLMNGIDGVRYAIDDGLEAAEFMLDQSVQIGEAIYTIMHKNISETTAWHEAYEMQIEDVKQLTSNIKRNPHGLRFSSPDVKAKLITSLLSEYRYC
jgi:hypothetical protein